MIKEVNYVISIGDSCVPAAICIANGVKKKTIGSGLIFDWATSNLHAVHDIIENDYNWYIDNMVNSEKIYETPYRYKKLYWPHHKDNIEYKKTIGRKFFDILNKTNISILFLYMSKDIVHIEDLYKLDNLLSKKYSFNYNITVGISYNEEEYIKINKNIDVYKCNSPEPFVNNFMKNDSYYPELFKKLIPYNLNKIVLS